MKHVVVAGVARTREGGNPARAVNATDKQAFRAQGRQPGESTRLRILREGGAGAQFTAPHGRAAAAVPALLLPRPVCTTSGGLYRVGAGWGPAGDALRLGCASESR